MRSIREALLIPPTPHVEVSQVGKEVVVTETRKSGSETHTRERRHDSFIAAHRGEAWRRTFYGVLASTELGASGIVFANGVSKVGEIKHDPLKAAEGAGEIFVSALLLGRGVVDGIKTGYRHHRAKKVKAADKASAK